MLTAELPSQDHRELLDLVDRLRSFGIARYIDIPQIVVTGDQSSGKSSVLEAISRLSFPSKDNLCTRFPTELSLRRGEQSSIKVSIISDDARTEQERHDLSQFNYDVDIEHPDLSEVIEAAKKAMGISKSKTFSSDILRIEITGPEHLNLTLVDLPGLFRAGNKEQSIAGAELVDKMVRKYLENPKSIVLAVVSAKVELALQEITKLTKEFDKEGNRTLGLITKPDTLSTGSDSEASFIELAQNEDIKYRLGWHVLCNRSWETRDVSSDERDRNEEQFFANGRWANLDRDIVGVSSLRLRLSNILKNQIAQHLPGLQSDVNLRLLHCREQVNKLGEPRASLREKKGYLRRVSSDFTDLIEDSINGRYKHPFLIDAADDETKRSRLLGLVVLGQMKEFAYHMKEYGHALIIGGEDVKNERYISREDYLAVVNEELQSHEVSELQGQATMAAVTKLLHRQNSPWKNIVSSTIEKIIEQARTTTYHVLQHVAVQESVDKLSVGIDRDIDQMAEILRKKVNELMQPYVTGRPITHNINLLETVQRKKEERKARVGAIDMQREACEDCLQWMETYYFTNLSTLIDNVRCLAVDAQLLQKLPGVLHPNKIADLTDEEVEELAAEGKKTLKERNHLETQMLALQSASSELRRFRRHSMNAIAESTKKAETTLPIRERSPSPSISISSPASTIDTPSSVVGGKLGSRTSEQGPVPFDYYSLPSSSPRPKQKKTDFPRQATVEDELHA